MKKFTELGTRAQAVLKRHVFVGEKTFDELRPVIARNVASGQIVLRRLPGCGEATAKKIERWLDGYPNA